MQSKMKCLGVSLPAAHSVLLQTFEALHRLEAAVVALSISRSASLQSDYSLSPISSLDVHLGFMVTCVHYHLLLRIPYYLVMQTSN